MSNKKQTGIVDERLIQVRKNFNHKRYNELWENPPKHLTNYKGEKFQINKEWFKKNLLYVHNAVFKVLDVLGLFGGEEGTGKSTDMSQWGQTIYYILIECEVVSEKNNNFYEFNEKNCLAHNLISFLKLCDKYNDELFRIILCDEAGGLKGEDRWDEWNKKFRDDMRKDRKKLRFKGLAYPQVFELVKDMTLGRVSFMRISEFREDKQKGLIPDIVKTIIIPRGKYTFSWHTNEMISKTELKKALFEQSKERYTKTIQKKFIYNTTKKDNVFCFNVKQYLIDAINENKLFLKEEKIYLSNRLIEILANNLTAGKIGLSISVPKDLTGEELKEAEQERKDALLISKLVNKCRAVIKNQTET